MYKDLIKNEVSCAVWDHLSFDEDGDLWLDNICLMDLVSRYGSPLAINYLPLIRKRADEFKNIVKNAAKKVGYAGTFEYLYATKANMRAEFIRAADEACWNLETSSNQDLLHIELMKNKDMLKNNSMIVCNGIKGLQHKPNVKHTIKSPGVVYLDKLPSSSVDINQYADNIIRFHNEGKNIVPVLDLEEFEYFSSKYIKDIMPVGLRMRFGNVHSPSDFKTISSRHGMEWTEAVTEAKKISAHPNLRLTMLHCMAGVTADNMSPASLSQSLLEAAKYYFLLKQKFPTLKDLNIGGGIPPLNRDFDYQRFLEIFFTSTNKLAARYGCSPPSIIFELGTYLADEAGLYIYEVVQKRKGYTYSKMRTTWAIVNAGLMADLPDSLFVGKHFDVLAVNQANCASTSAILGDISCDTDGRYPNAHSKYETIIIPDSNTKQYLLINGVGAYQKILTGENGAHHCGILNSKRIIIDRIVDRLQCSLVESQTTDEYSKALGY